MLRTFPSGNRIPTFALVLIALPPWLWFQICVSWFCPPYFSSDQSCSSRLWIFSLMAFWLSCRLQYSAEQRLPLSWVKRLSFCLNSASRMSIRVLTLAMVFFYFVIFNPLVFSALSHYKRGIIIWNKQVIKHLSANDLRIYLHYFSNVGLASSFSIFR